MNNKQKRIYKKNSKNPKQSFNPKLNSFSKNRNFYTKKKSTKFNKFAFVNREISKTDFYIKDPVHKEINFREDSWIANLIYSRELLRLLEIKQLGISYRTFPTATHNRYSHCLGTFSLAQKFATRFKNEITLSERKLLLAAALLHDIGHGPYSHLFEKISNKKHEEFTTEIILSPEFSVFHHLTKNDIDPYEVAAVFNKGCKKKWINQLISSNLDVDRMDYLLRDAYFIGTNYSTIDIDFLIERAYLKLDKVCFSKSAANYIESFLIGRHYMHTDIYYNKFGFVYEWCLVSIFERLKELQSQFIKNKDKIYYYDCYKWIVFNQNVDLITYLSLNDNNLNAFICSLRVIDDEILVSFIENFFYPNEVKAFWFKDGLYESYLKKAINLNIDKKYAIKVAEKKNVEIYFPSEKNKIFIYDEQERKISDFNSQKILSFSENSNTYNNRILLVNTKIIR